MQPSLPILEEDAWKLKYGDPARFSSPGHQRRLRAARAGEGVWAAVSNFDEAADRLEEVRMKWGAISEADWKQRYWGTHKNALDGQQFRLAEASSGQPHTWWFETEWSPPLAAIRALSGHVPHIPMRLIFNEELGELYGSQCFLAGREVAETDLPVPERMRQWLTG